MRKALLSGLLTSTLLAALVSGASAAGADPAQSGAASGFGITASVAGTELIPPSPEASVAAPPFADDNNETAIPIPADPLAVNGTLIAQAAVHEDADLDTVLETEDQAVAGPYNARAVGAVEDLEVLIDAVGDDVPLIEADVLRGEVVAVCSGDTVEYSAMSEDVNLAVAGEGALGAALDDLLDALFPGLDPLDPVVNFEQNVVTELADGLAVDALVVSVLEAIDEEAPLVQVRVGHAELSGVACGALPECSDGIDNPDPEDELADEDDPGCHSDGDADNPDSYDPEDDDETDETDLPECSDGVDNDGDGEIDFPDDNGCDSPDDDDESDECSDGVDNDGDGVADIDDPGCHTDGDPNNPDSYDPNDDDESDGSRALPTTGASVPTATAVGLGLAGLALVALRRRSEA